MLDGSPVHFHPQQTINAEISAMKHRSLFLFATFVCVSSIFAQQLSPGVGNAVLLATNSIQIDNATVIVSGDIIVNNATSGPVLGEKALSLDNGVRTPAGYKLA